MFSLIITVISIALVAALAVSTIYFGGDSFNQGTSQARANTLINQATQIDAARQLHRAREGTYAADIGTLDDKDYLASAPGLDDDNGAFVGWTIEGNGTSDDAHIFNLSEFGDADDLCDAVDENSSSLYRCDENNETFEFGAVDD